jgi:16S rRNA (guanine527-N7)-methyltransferase
MSAAKAAQIATISPADRAAALELIDVSRETTARLDTFVEVLLLWQNKTNLIASSTIPRLWTRHIADSLQLLELAPHAKVWVDLGSGGGFPGIPIACALGHRANPSPNAFGEIGGRLDRETNDVGASTNAVVHLVESNAKKAAFLREAVRATQAPAQVHAMRIEKFVNSFPGAAEVVTARALAPLKTLLDQCLTIIQAGALGLFPKGQDVDAELTLAAKYWNINHTLVPSRTDPNGRIVVVHALERR